MSLSMALWLVGKLPRGIHSHAGVYPDSLVISRWVLTEAQGICLDMYRAVRGH